MNRRRTPLRRDEKEHGRESGGCQQAGAEFDEVLVAVQDVALRHGVALIPGDTDVLQRKAG